MSSTVDSAGAAPADEAGRRDALAERLFKAMIQSMELASVWSGLRLRLYDVLAEYGPARSTSSGASVLPPGPGGRPGSVWVQTARG